MYTNQVLEQLHEANKKEEEAIEKEISNMTDTIKERRKSLNISQSEMVAISGIPQTTISRIENKSSIPTLKNLLKMCRALGLSIEIK